MINLEHSHKYLYNKKIDHILANKTQNSPT